LDDRPVDTGGWEMDVIVADAQQRHWPSRWEALQARRWHAAPSDAKTVKACADASASTTEESA
jgi:hypothetical protein